MDQKANRIGSAYRLVQGRMPSQKDMLHFRGSFMATNTSVVSRGAIGEGDTVLTWASTKAGNLAFTSEDHRDIRLHYHTGMIPRLLYGTTYSLEGRVLGGRAYEMPFLDCEGKSATTLQPEAGKHDPPRITGVGSIIGVFKMEGDYTGSHNLEVFVTHEVDKYTVSQL
ncbi:hypothetical protein MJO29_000102 [Puccinia striiformis f. sp. tritici]|uniref:hypothetical protein n=1 Tax=Puccinia striiformis f. sp. tritici TaxID=168172 RepID=UPI0020080E09|nr:hypothetical protein Pst134EA_000099 [Puccinia striiformis f. sp. tritici]KAH9473019.1 hypothetical protein Pst134EA_000099 [Puccinia striiformis f. sp. tritici]KAI7966825.1 hypothetical protein MJO29_000102 [Puccinia striiformis f. sp. tritici]